ncbi:MAG: RNA-binding domain-containing protein [Candidatus Methanoperedens sp.]|nr:RNA-binding domain-containing protein [Candidatus Methanoperedens sp.]
MNITVRVSALVYPTETEEKVMTSITNIFPLEFALRNFGIPQLYGEGGLESLRKFHLLLRDLRILDTSRRIFMNNMEGNTIQFRLNKQVAFVGKVNFPVGEESLGSIHVEITSDNEEDLMKIIDWLAPDTVEGVPVMEIEL